MLLSHISSIQLPLFIPVSFSIKLNQPKGQCLLLKRDENKKPRRCLRGLYSIESVVQLIQQQWLPRQ